MKEKQIYGNNTGLHVNSIATKDKERGDGKRKKKLEHYVYESTYCMKIMQKKIKYNGKTQM